jgi:hypothetical protein
MKIILDIAALISALAWPLVVVVGLLAYRKSIPELVGAIGRSVRKLEVPGFSIELATAVPATSEWQGGPKALDLRRSATAVEVSDSTAAAFTAQLIEGGVGDYSEVDLGRGREWLTSRLYIMAILFPRMKGVRTFVFLETAGEVRKKFLGFADPAAVRWALAKQYPWLEPAYANAYASVLPNSIVVSNAGRLGLPANKYDPAPGVQLLQKFLENIQSPPLPAPLPGPPPVPPALPGPPPGWVEVSETPPYTLEQAHWLTGELLEELLKPDLDMSAVADPGATAKTADLVGAIAAQPGGYVAVTRSDGRLEYVVNRLALVDQVAGPIKP